MLAPAFAHNLETQSYSSSMGQWCGFASQTGGQIRAHINARSSQGRFCFAGIATATRAAARITATSKCVEIISQSQPASTEMHLSIGQAEWNPMGLGGRSNSLRLQSHPFPCHNNAHGRVGSL